MDLQGSLVNTNLRIYPSKVLIDYFKSLQIDDNVPVNVIKFVKGEDYVIKQSALNEKETIPIHLNSKDIENLDKIKETVGEEIVTEAEEGSSEKKTVENDTTSKESSTDCDNTEKPQEESDKSKKSKEECNEKIKESTVNDNTEDETELYLTTTDIDWLYNHLLNLRSKGDANVPYLHALLEGVEVKTPKNEVIKRNPVLEARCVKLRAQQEARVYRKMTKSVDNVRMRFPEDSISYQLKQVNRQLIAIGQFIISIFAGFLFGFKGVDWMIGNLDFGFRLLLGVMCALIIALAEIYFLAKKLNEELNVPETVQLGGPPKFVDQETYFVPKVSKKAIDKEHQD